MNETADLMDWIRPPHTAGAIHLTTIHHKDRVGYDRLYELASAWATSVSWEDAASRDSVALIATPSAALFGAFFGLLSGGADVCMIAPPGAIADREAYRRYLRGALQTVGARLLLCEERLAAGIAEITGAAGEIAIRPLPADGRPDAAAMTAVRLSRNGRPGDLLQLTSGSSGASRCVQLSPEAVIRNVSAIADRLSIVPAEDVGASWLPLYHDMGLIGCFLLAVSHQGDLHLVEPAVFVRSPARFLSFFGRRTATLSAIPPFGLELITRRVSGPDLAGLDFSGLRALITGSERIPMELLERFSALLAPYGFQSHAICPGYGLAECAVGVTLSRPGDPPRASVLADAYGGRYVACGAPLRGAQVRVVDPSGQEVTGKVGEIVVSSPSLAHGYRGTVTSSTRFKGRELWTGDAGFLLDGELHVVGRLGDAVKVRGTWLFSEDLESLIDDPAFREGRAAIVVGQEGEKVKVLLVSDHRADLDTGKLARHLAAQGIVASVDTVTAARRDIPCTSSGKPRRREIWLKFAG
jgi:acyl-CoA synthetase (AMP-forming)/AMP-acid ligase II